MPVRQALLREIDQRFQLEAQLIHSTITGYLEHSVDLASQIPSRSEIRRQMLRYVWGEISQEDYRQFAEPRLTEAVRASDGIIAVTRVDRNRVPLVVVGAPLRVPESLQFHPGSGEIVGTVMHTDSSAAYIVTVPIRDPVGGLLGYDLVGFSLAALRDQLSRATRLFDATSATLSVDGETIARAGPRQLDDTRGDQDDAGGHLATVRYRLASQWELAVARPRRLLYAPAETFLQRMAIVIVIVSAAVLVIVHRSLAAVHERARTAELERDVANRRILLQEVHHRIKNDLSMVGSLLSLQSRSSSEQAVQAALSEAEHRVTIVSQIYDQLYQTEEFGRVRIREVLREFMRQFRGESITLSAQDLLLPRKVAVPVGIIVNELVVNAIKYGRPVSGEAEIAVDLNMDDAGALHISVRDNGPGFSSHDPAELSGFGLSMVETLGSQFDGELTIPVTESGGAIEIVLRNVERTSE